MTPPLVSVLVPAFNAEPWIAETLDAALGQTWPNIEVIVVDDGSFDRTAEIAEQYAARGVRLIRQGRRGPSVAQNEALRHARGAFIQRLDADDVLAPDKIERQMDQLGCEVSCVACGAWARFQNHIAEARFDADTAPGDLDPVEWLVRECGGGLPMLQPGRWLVPRGVAEAAGPWDESLTLNNDFEYFVRVVLASRSVRCTPAARLYYRSGISTSLGSTRSAAGWESALRSFDCGTRHLLARDSRRDVRRACADLFQTLSFDAYLEHREVARRAEARAAELGGSAVRMGGGVLFRMLERAFGWKVAKQVKAAAYGAGYGAVAARRRHEHAA